MDPTARPGGRAGRGAERAGNLAWASREGSLSSPTPESGFPCGSLCSLGGREPGLGGEVFLRLGLLLRSLPPETPDKAVSSRFRLPPGRRGTVGRGGGEAARGAADSLLLDSLPGEGPKPVSAPLPPFRKRERHRGNPPAFLLPCLTMRDASPVTGVR